MSLDLDSVGIVVVVDCTILLDAIVFKKVIFQYGHSCFKNVVGKNDVMPPGVSCINIKPNNTQRSPAIGPVDSKQMPTAQNTMHPDLLAPGIDAHVKEDSSEEEVKKR